MSNLTTVILDYKASVPSSMVGGTAATTVPQVPTQLQVADLGMYLPVITPSPINNRVELFADVGAQLVTGAIFNNALIFHIYRDGREVFNTDVGLQGVNLSGPIYNFAFSTIDESVPFGFHVYQLTVSAVIDTAQSSVQVIGPITFSGFAFGKQ